MQRAISRQWVTWPHDSYVYNNNAGRTCWMPSSKACSLASSNHCLLLSSCWSTASRPSYYQAHAASCHQQLG
jgi:hypothetical protein